MGNIRWHQLIGPLLKEDCSLQFISYTGYFSVFPMCVYLNTVGYFATYQFVCDYIPRESSKQKYAPVVIYIYKYSGNYYTVINKICRTHLTREKTLYLMSLEITRHRHVTWLFKEPADATAFALKWA